MTPLIIYIIGLILLAFLVFGFIYACDLYKKALELNPDRETLNQIRAQIQTANSTLATIQEEKKALSADILAGQRVIDEAKLDKAWLEQNKTSIDSLRQSIKKEQDALNDLLSLIATRSNEKTQLDNALQQTAGQKQALDFEVQRLTQEKSQLQGVESRLKATQQELQKLDIELAQRKIDRHRLEDKIQSLSQKKNEHLQAAESRLKFIEGEIESKRNERKHIEKEVADLNSRRGNLLSVVKEEERRWVDLDDAAHVPNISIKNTAQYEEDDWLNDFKQNLKDSGLSFDERIINAFHTGLKVADYSPLVVLAGISGTGKSLLPELYAHAIGMNFLQVAVQPRWDSPQDMLGFYNYMEGRFKATELSRLLWQSDPFNNENAQQRAMNLVLLDEMNLARVEYYFSDMLSKLEVRRGLDPKTQPEERKAAEIVIDCGYSKEVASTRRIFVGKNTLFVGTMNEDESTQSLSDKVVDRSNIIRFGRPANLDVKPKKEEFFKRCRSRAMLPESWAATCKSAASNQRLLDIMNQLNSELDNVGRPFAHRVWLSVLAYVTNYPHGNFNNAVADQIEMKILPKLTGLDITDNNVKTALNKINTIITQECHDDALSKAYGRALEAAENANFFQWKGVTRT